MLNNDSGARLSLWMATAEIPDQPPLKSNVSADVCIVGAGIAGLTTAYLLAREGNSVVVLEDGPVGGGETGRTTAHISNALDDRYYELERLHGREGARLAAESHTAAINMIEKITREEKIDCDFTRLDGYLFVPPDDSLDELDLELKALHGIGMNQVERVENSPLTAFKTGPCLRFPDQGQFHSIKYLRGLVAAIQRLGGKIYCNTHAEEIQGGEKAFVRSSDNFNVSAAHIVVATNSPVNDMLVIHTKQAPYRTYVIGALIPKDSVELGLYWDTDDPYHYIRISPYDAEHDILIVGGEDHKTGQENDYAEHFDCLEEWTTERFPMVQRIKYRWSGQVMEPVDGLAFIGKNPADEENIYIITGDSGNGITHGTIGGILITDLIMGRENPWTKLYDPSRITLSSTWEFAKENANVLAQYSDLVTGGDVDNFQRVKPGEGAIVRDGMKKLAVYRDEQGKLTKLSAVCTHLGCVVHWNSAEKTWDCPCHGSRFATDGKVLNGPANVPLPPAEE